MDFVKFNARSKNAAESVILLDAIQRELVTVGKSTTFKYNKFSSA
jgi:hypothetical protein